jgi:hypothetical protein
MLIGKAVKPCPAMQSPRSCTTAAAPGSLPIRCLVAISQAEAALTRTALAGAAIAACAAGDNRASPASHQSSAWVSSSRRIDQRPPIPRPPVPPPAVARLPIMALSPPTRSRRGAITGLCSPTEFGYHPEAILTKP